MSRLAPPVAAHLAGAAVDLTLVDLLGRELDMGTPIAASPQESRGRCFFDAPDLPTDVRGRRALLAQVLTEVGLVNYPTEWWHWSYGDRHWARLTGATAALFGAVHDLDDPAQVDDVA